MSEKIREFKSNFVLLTLWKGQTGKDDYFTLAQISKTDNGKWKYLPFFRAKDIADLINVANQWLETPKEQ